MITIQPEHKLMIAFTNDDDRNDISTFVSIVDKCAKEAKKSGFKKMFTAEESFVLTSLKETLEK